MKILAVTLLTLGLVACGGGDLQDTPASIGVPSATAKAAKLSGGAGVALHMYQALYGKAPSYALMTDYTAQATANASAFANTLTSPFANTSHTALAKLVLDNLGVTASTVKAVNSKGESEYTLLLDAVQQIFGAFPTLRGQVILNMTNLLADLEADGTYGAAAVVYNNQAAANQAYALNAANTSPAVVALVPDGTSVTGRFVDATVVGLAYKCGNSAALSGTTDSNGQYTCLSNQSVTFYVGGILIGSVNSPRAVVTPLDLVGVGASPSNQTVNNMVRFLMSISSTAPGSGTLTIDPAIAAAAVAMSIDFATTTAAHLDALITNVKPGATPVTSAAAITHLTGSINGLFAGPFSGTFGGAFGGNWKVTIDSAGQVVGTATDSDGGVGVVTGSMSTAMSTVSSYAFNGSSGGTPWIGALNVSTRQFSGTWDAGSGVSGTFTGTASQP